MVVKCSLPTARGAAAARRSEQRTSTPGKMAGIKLPTLTPKGRMPGVATQSKLYPVRRPRSALPKLEHQRRTNVPHKHKELKATGRKSEEYGEEEEEVEENEVREERTRQTLCSCDAKHFTQEGKALVNVMVTMATCLCDKDNGDELRGWGESRIKIKNEPSKIKKRLKKEQASNSSNLYRQPKSNDRQDYHFVHHKDYRKYMEDYRRHVTLAAGYVVEDVPDCHATRMKCHRDWLFGRFLRSNTSASAPFLTHQQCATPVADAIETTKAALKYINEITKTIYKDSKRSKSAQKFQEVRDSGSEDSMPLDGHISREYTLAPVRSNPWSESSECENGTIISSSVKSFSLASSYMNLASPKVALSSPGRAAEKTASINGSSRMSQNSKCNRKNSANLSQPPQPGQEKVKLPASSSINGKGLSSRMNGILQNFPRYSSATSSQISGDSAYISASSSQVSKMSSKLPTRIQCPRASSLNCTVSPLGKGRCKRKDRIKSDNNVKIHYMSTSMALIPATGSR